MLEFTQVGKVIQGRQTLLPCPVEGFIQPSLPRPQACLHCCYRTYIWEKVTHKMVLSLVEQVERTVQISLCLLYSSHCNTPSIPELWEPNVLTQFLASQQVLRGRTKVVMFTGELTHPNVHVSSPA
ncbi:hypothetical protein D3C72_1084820 [compost metagenome]